VVEAVFFTVRRLSYAAHGNSGIHKYFLVSIVTPCLLHVFGWARICLVLIWSPFLVSFLLLAHVLNEPWLTSAMGVWKLELSTTGPVADAVLSGQSDGPPAFPMQQMLDLMMVGISAVAFDPMMEEVMFRLLPDRLLRLLHPSNSTTKGDERIKAPEHQIGSTSLSMKVVNRKNILYFVGTFRFAAARIDCMGKDGLVSRTGREIIDIDSLQQQVILSLCHCIYAFEFARLAYQPLYQHSSVWASFGAHVFYTFLGKVFYVFTTCYHTERL
jgi:hypothetical protein